MGRWFAAHEQLQGSQLVHGRNQLIRQQTWYAFGVLILVLRHIVRLRTVGVRGYQGDDYLSILVRHLPIIKKVKRSIFQCLHIIPTLT